MTKRASVTENMLISKADSRVKVCNCPKCGVPAKRHSTVTRWIRDVHPTKTLILEVQISKHYCKTCDRHFSKASEFAPFGSTYSYRVHRLAVDLVNSGITLSEAKRRLEQEHNVIVPAATIHDWCGDIEVWNPPKPKQA